MSILVQEKPVSQRYISGALLVGGTCIGGGMLAMPIQTAEAGFWLSVLSLLLGWVFMTFTGLLLVEATLWFKSRAHFSTMAHALLGIPGRVVSVAVYLFMNSASLVAYTSGGALLIDGWIKGLTGASLGYAGSCIFFTLIFGTLVSLGAFFTAKVNSWMALLMGAAYCFLVGSGLSHIQGEYLAFRSGWLHGANAFPIILTSFSYQMVVPTVCSYLNYDARALKKAVWIGTSFPCVIYCLWMLVIHGMVPFEGPNGLHQAFLSASLIADPIRQQFASPFLRLMTDTFSFLALVTSYLGLSLALFDFVKDATKRLNPWFNRHTISILSLASSMILAIFFPRALLECLDISGGFGDTLLSGLIPISMVWIGRYRKGLMGDFQAPGGKLFLLLAGGMAVSIFSIQWVKLFIPF